MSVDSLTLGGNASAALGSGTAVFCGDNSAGQCGADPSSFTQFDSPYMSPLPSLKKLVLGRSHACGIDMADVVQCWGVGTSGQLGDGTQTGMTYQPVKVAW
jgi:alpha-tubulin suppressor-like RCC1 family protein